MRPYRMIYQEPILRWGSDRGLRAAAERAVARATREFRRMRRDGWPAYVVSTHAQADAVIELVKSGLAT